MKITKTIIALLTCVLASACSSIEKDDLVETKVIEKNAVVQDLEVTYYVVGDQCIVYEQSIAEIKDLNTSKPKAKYILSHKQIDCPK
ncbi:hypothetical protein [Photobacterium leiognathi]|uniref:hypothetical protein n=1 Tax=Photobacterium leiognathi TaxID=553611 RepID=UPI002982237F|nr:hypothetical protein [Photobacterium leiognathi]